MILKTNKLIKPNYHDWLRNLKIVLDSEKCTYILDGTAPDTTPDDDKDTCNTIAKWVEDDLEARCLMLACMSNDLQKQHENMKHATKIHTHLQELYGVQTQYECFVT